MSSPHIYKYGKFLLLIHGDKKMERETQSGFIMLGFCYHELLT